MDIVAELNTRYREYLLARPDETAAERKELDRRLLRRTCVYDGGPIPTFMKPLFLSPAQDRLLRRACRLLSAAVEKATGLYFTSGDFAEMTGLGKEERAMMEIEPGYSGRVTLARFDGFLEGLDLTFLEFNADSPAGLADDDILSDEFLALSPMRELSRDFAFEREEMKESYLRVLLEKYGEYGGVGKPKIAIVDWHEVKNRTEFRLLADYFEQRGFPSIVCDPRELELKGDRLAAGGFRIDLVVRRVIVRELAERRHEVGDFIEAARRGAACFVNSFQSKLAGFKGLLNIMSDPANEGLFTGEEREAIRAHIPWSRPARRGRVDFHGESEDLEGLLLGEKDRFVVKPSHGYGGEGVHIGYLCDGKEWRNIVEGALAGDFVVQEVVAIPEEEFPVFNPGPEFVRKKVNINPFVLDGEYVGAIARVSDSAVINLTRGGGQLPVFTARRRGQES